MMVHAWAYDGLDNRYRADSESYVFDIAAGLAQVLSDGATDYLCGVGLIPPRGRDAGNN